MIDAELYAWIRRLFFAEHWKVGTLAAEPRRSSRDGRACDRSRPVRADAAAAPPVAARSV
jgi:hypothetical protein